MSPDEPKPPSLAVPAENLQEEDASPAPAIVMELCAACVRYVATRYKVPLDFTSDTLSLLDAYVRDARADVKARPESLGLVAATIGAYLGEVMRRAFGGSWFAEGEPDGWRVDLHNVYLTFNPVGMAREAILLETQDGWHAHLETDPGEQEIVERRLAALEERTGGTKEEEYYAPTTRYDVVEIAVEALRAHMLEQGVGDVRFTAEDYRSS